MMNKVTKTMTVLLISLLLIIITSFSVGSGLGENDTGALSFRGELENGEFILEMDDYGIDENNDTSYDNLMLNLKINISDPDDYLIIADMKPWGIITGDRVSEYFATGVYNLDFSFNGAAIYENASDGPYTISITVYKNWEPIIKNLNYTTSEYKYEDFNPKPVSDLPEKASIEVADNTIKLKTEVFTAVIYELTPMIEFYYSIDDGQQARFKVTYERIICFSDQDGNGKFQENELRYYGDLLNSRWNSKKVLMENFNSYDFSVHSIVDLYDSNNIPIDTKLELVFHYSSATKLEDLSAAQKFDINIKVRGIPFTGITHMALEHKLTDETLNHEFLRQETDVETKVSFMSNEDEERGYYSWKNSLELTSSAGAARSEDVGYNLEPTLEPAVNKLYLNYPYSPDVIELFHDPVVGVNPQNLPPIPTKPPSKVIDHQIIIYIIVAVIAAVVMLGNIYRQRKKK